jgi:hypothetical protein
VTSVTDLPIPAETGLRKFPQIVCQPRDNDASRNGSRVFPACTGARPQFDPARRPR